MDKIDSFEIVRGPKGGAFMKVDGVILERKVTGVISIAGRERPLVIRVEVYKEPFKEADGEMLVEHIDFEISE